MAWPPVPTVEPLDAQTPADLERLCSSYLSDAERRLRSIGELADAPSSDLRWENTFGRLDDVRLALANASEYPYLVGIVHPDEAMRTAGAECERRVDAFETQLHLDTAAERTLSRYAAKGERLTTERARFVEQTRAAFVTNGSRLDTAKRARLTVLNEAITEAGQRFIEALSGPAESVRVSVGALRGTSERFRRAHPPGTDSLVPVSLDPSDAVEFYTSTQDRKAARRVYAAFVNRGGRANVERLEALLALRAEKAHLLGFATWADFVTSTRMAGSAKEVTRFLDRAESAIASAVKRETEDLAREGRRVPELVTSPRLLDSDRLFLVERLKAKQAGYDSTATATHFERRAVEDTLIALGREWFGLEFVERERRTWHASVRSFEVLRDGQPVGWVFFDLAARPNKYPNPAMFSLRTARRTGERPQLPMAAILAALAPYGAPMPHEQVVLLFHEFGHVLSQLCAENELSSFAGTNLARDFLETPSQVFEEWAWSPRVLDRIVARRSPGQALPRPMLRALVASRAVGSATALARQLFLARVDLALHTAEPPVDSTSIVRSIQAAHYPLAPVEDTHLQSSFSHLVGYDAAYYGYAWSQALANDMWTRFEREATTPEGAARVSEDFRRDILARGGGHDERTMVREFLGRDADEAALLRGVGAAPSRPAGRELTPW